MSAARAHAHKHNMSRAIYQPLIQFMIAMASGAAWFLASEYVPNSELKPHRRLILFTVGLLFAYLVVGSWRVDERDLSKTHAQSRLVINHVSKSEHHKIYPVVVPLFLIAINSYARLLMP